MKKAIFTLIILLFASTPCWAEFSLYSNIKGKMEASYSLPSGAKQSCSVVPGWGGALSYGSSDNVPGALANIDVTIVDDLGATIWSGKIHNWACMVLFRTADGKAQCVPAGWCLNSGQKMPHAVRLLNLTGQSLDFQLQGNGGLQACPVSLKPVLDTEQVTRLPEGEENYYAQFSGNKGDNVLNPGWIYLVYKTSDGKYDVKQCGTIMTPSECETK